MLDSLPDVLRSGLKIVFCGTAAGTVSAKRRAYYAGRGNCFWAILAKTGLTPRQLRPDEFPILSKFGIGLTDVAKAVAGADSDIPAHAFDRGRLAASIHAARPGHLAFNGKKAASAFLGLPTRSIPYGPLDRLPDFPPVTVLPSTSGAASGFWDPAPCMCWLT